MVEYSKRLSSIKDDIDFHIQNIEEAATPKRETIGLVYALCIELLERNVPLPQIPHYTDGKFRLLWMISQDDIILLDLIWDNVCTMTVYVNSKQHSIDYQIPSELTQMAVDIARLVLSSKQVQTEEE